MFYMSNLIRRTDLPTCLAKYLTTERDEDLNDTPLHIAIKDNQDSMFHELINVCDVNARNSNDETPLHYAVLNNRVEFTRLLIENGADVDPNCWERGTPLICALKNQNIEIAEILFKNGAVLDRQERHSIQSLLPSAVLNGNLEMVKYIMERGWDNNIDTSEYMYCPLHKAVTSGHLDVVEYLIKYGIMKKKETITEDCLDLITVCLESGRLKILQFLIDVGLKTTRDCFSSTITWYPHESWLFLLTCRSKIDAKTYFSRTELHRAVDAGELETVKMIVKQQANTVVTDSLACKLAVYIAVENRNEDVLQVLLNAAGYSTEACFDDISPVHLAATFEDTKILEMLLKAGADVNSKTTSPCCTPIHFAATAIQLTAVEFLLESGADVEHSLALSFALRGITYSTINELAFTKLVKITEMLIPHTEKKEILHLLLNAITIKVESDDGNIQNSSYLKKEARYDYNNDSDNDDEIFLKKSKFCPQLVRCIFNHVTDDEIKYYSKSILQTMCMSNHSSEMFHFLMEYNDSDLCSSIEIGHLKVNYKCRLLLIDYSRNVDDLIKFRMNTRSNYDDEVIVKKTVVLKLIIARLVLLNKSHDLKVKRVCTNDQFLEWCIECEKQKMKMRETEIVDNCRVTFYDILTEPVDKVANYLKNEDFRKVIEASYEKFSAYTDFLKIRIEKGIRRKELREECMDLMCNVIEKNYKIQLSNADIGHIFKYFSVVDLRRLSDSFS